jgi:hypothetical protein
MEGHVACITDYGLKTLLKKYSLSSFACILSLRTHLESSALCTEDSFFEGKAREA